MGRGPCVLGLHDVLRDGEVAVEILHVLVRGCGFADAQRRAIVGREHDGADLVALEGVTHGWPGGVDGLVEQCLLDRDQQVVGEHAEEGVSPILH